jgi:hypothetical protein
VETSPKVLLIQTALLASLASGASLAASSVTGSSLIASSLIASTVTASSAVTALAAAPTWAAYLLVVQAPWGALQSAPPCERVLGKIALPCSTIDSAPLFGATLPAGRYVKRHLELPSVSGEMDGTLGGFMNFDLMGALHLSAGPQVSWLTPDSPREDLLRLRVVAPGWGVRYTWDETVSVGVVACTRFVMFGEDWPVVDMLTSEARVEFLLP